MPPTKLHTVPQPQHEIAATATTRAIGVFPMGFCPSVRGMGMAAYNRRLENPAQNLVPTLRVGTPVPPLCGTNDSPPWDAERPDVRAHAPRGHEEELGLPLATTVAMVPAFPGFS